jgi:hypothetical protein
VDSVLFHATFPAVHHVICTELANVPIGLVSSRLVLCSCPQALFLRFTASYSYILRTTRIIADMNFVDNRSEMPVVPIVSRGRLDFEESTIIPSESLSVLDAGTVFWNLA